MKSSTKTVWVSIIASVILAFVYTNLSYWAGTTIMLFGVIAWNWNDFMVMAISMIGVTGMVTVILHHLMFSGKKNRGEHDRNRRKGK